jgi:type IV pilus assembly protein PilV
MSRRPQRQRGLTLIEVLITIVIFAVGILGLTKIMNRAALTEAEALQRAQAMVLAQDLADRMMANRANAASYLGSVAASGTIQGAACNALGTRAEVDLCQWSDVLRGAAMIEEGGARVGSMIGARACIEQLPFGAGTYAVTIAWQGLMGTGTPDNGCGTGSFGSEDLRRTYSYTFQIANLAAP